MTNVDVAGERVEVVDRFTYLGSVVHRSTSCEAEVNRRLGLAQGAMASLNRTVWRSRYLGRLTKVRVFRSLVLGFSTKYKVNPDLNYIIGHYAPSPDLNDIIDTVFIFCRNLSNFFPKLVGLAKRSWWRWTSYLLHVRIKRFCSPI